MLLHTARIEVTVADMENGTKQTYSSIRSVKCCQHVIAGSSEYDVVAKYGFGQLLRVEGNADELGVPVDDADLGLMDSPCGEREYR